MTPITPTNQLNLKKKDVILIDLLCVFPELFLFIAAIVLLVFGVSLHKNVFSTILFLSLFSIFLTGLLVHNTPMDSCHFFDHSFFFDPFSFFFKGFILLGSLIVLILSMTYVKKTKVYAFETIILILISVCTMMLLVSSYDLLPLYLTIELQSLCFYVLAASKRDSEFSTEAGLKYFLLGAFSSGILLFGFSLIYGFTGMTNFEDLAKFHQILLETSIPISIGVVFILVGFFFKMTAVPFHMWAPDVYQGAPTFITAFFAIVPKIAILGVFIRVFILALPQHWQIFLIISSTASLLIGAIAAIASNNFKRLIAFSSIGHVGFMFIGFCCATIQGLQALFIYLVIYLIMSCAIFSIALSLYREDKVEFIQFLSEFRFLGKTNPALAFSFSIVLFSIAGIPPLAGFCSKFFLFFAALSSSLFFLAFVGVFSSVISCFYYLRFIKIMYFEKKNLFFFHNFATISFQNSLILASICSFLICFFIYPSPLFLWTHKTAIAFFY